MNDRALFYFRDSAYIGSLSDKEKSDCLELPAEAEISKYGQEEAERRTEKRGQKLASLKERIRKHCQKNKMPEPCGYLTPKVLGEMVLRDMTVIVERLYPKDEIPNAAVRLFVSVDFLSVEERAIFPRIKKGGQKPALDDSNKNKIYCTGTYPAPTGSSRLIPN